MKGKRVIAGILLVGILATALAGCKNADVTKKEREKPVITLGSDSYPPYNYLNEDGIPTGIDVELATEAFRRMGYQVDVVQINWEKKKELVESGEIDCIMGCFSMEGRLDDYRWAGPYIASRQVVAVNESSDIYKLSDLEGKNLAVQSTTKPEGIFLNRTDERIPKLGNLISLGHRELIYTFLGKGYVDAVAAHEESIVQYMKDISGLSLAETLLEQGNQLEDLQGRDLEAEWDAAEESLKEEIFRRKKLQDKDWDGEIPETPSDAVRATRSEGILGAAAQGMQLSSACLSGAGRPSVRHLNSGTGLSDGKEAVNSLVDQGLLYAYILKKCGSFGQEKENSALAYEVEYILQQQTQDRENLKKTLQEILLLREAVNAAFLFGSSLKAEAETAAGVIAILLGLPEIKDLAATVILFAWAYAESVKDVRILLRGDKIPLVKSEESWNTPFSQLLTYRSHLDSYRSSADGMSYQDYLGALLVCHGAKKAIAGLMDVMESDIRQTPGNSNFRLDGLIDGMQACIRVVSGYTGSYEITRRYEYE